MFAYPSYSKNVLHFKYTLLTWLIIVAPTFKYTWHDYYENCVAIFPCGVWMMNNWITLFSFVYVFTINSPRESVDVN